MRKILFATVAAALITGTTVTLATAGKNDFKCTDAPRNTWISLKDITVKGEKLGYNVTKVEVDDNCYELEGTDKNGAKIEIKFHPVSGDIVPYKHH